jgi:hypothetical protein
MDKGKNLVSIYLLRLNYKTGINVVGQSLMIIKVCDIPMGGMKLGINFSI